jgi:hypothetical protein
MKWKPIETAPNNETILIYRDNGRLEIVDEEDNDFDWEPYDGKRLPGVSKPTHWVALSEIPLPG